MYAWMARWLQQAPADTRRPERSFTPDAPADLMVFHQRPLPGNAVTPAELTYNWIEAARRQLTPSNAEDSSRALRHVLGYGSAPATPRGPALPNAGRIVLVANVDEDVEQALRGARFDVRKVALTPFDAEAAAKVRHFDTYNHTPAGHRVADIVEALRKSPGAAFVAAGDAALAGLLAAAIEAPRALVLDVAAFDTSSDEDFANRLYIPGLRRAGDLETAAAAYRGTLIVHNAGERFTLRGAAPRRTKMSAAEIVAALRNSGRAR
jgi:hypothetical protein